MQVLNSDSWPRYCQKNSFSSYFLAGVSPNETATNVFKFS